MGPHRLVKGSQTGRKIWAFDSRDVEKLRRTHVAVTHFPSGQGCGMSNQLPMLAFRKRDGRRETELIVGPSLLSFILRILTLALALFGLLYERVSFTQLMLVVGSLGGH